MAAWPAPREMLLDGWLLRAAGGGVRRPNSVNPIRGGARDPSAVLPAVEAIYGALGQAALFRVLSITPEMDAVLEDHGYAAEGATLTLYNDIAGFAIPSDNSVADGGAELAVIPGAAWLEARSELSRVAAAEARIFETTVNSIMVPRAFAARREGEKIAALAYGVVCNGLGVIESVVTDETRRRRGYGRQVVGRLLQWAKDEGAEGVCLQVVTDNEAARGLYRSLGFTTELHSYHYRRKSPG